MFWLSSLRQRARQRRFPPEFRITELRCPPAPPALPPPAPVHDHLPAVPADLDDESVAAIATNLWRVLKRFAGAEHDDVPRAQRLATRNLMAMSERLGDAGIEVQDHDRILFDTGLKLVVIAYEPRPDIDRETVVETVLPSIYRARRCIQIGQVIVGMPPERKNDDSHDR